jgi:hypothetical protein
MTKLGIVNHGASRYEVQGDGKRIAVFDELADAKRFIDADNTIRLLLNLTPGGSEYHGSPERCAEWIRDRLSSTGKLAAERNRLRTAADALAEAGEKAENALEIFANATEVRYFTDSEIGAARAALRELSAALRQYQEVSK